MKFNVATVGLDSTLRMVKTAAIDMMSNGVSGGLIGRNNLWVGGSWEFCDSGSEMKIN